MIGVGVQYSGVEFNMAEKSQKTSKGLEKNKYSNAVNRTTSESLRLGDSDKSINHPTSLISSATNAKKKTSFQITSVTVGSRTSNDGGDDSADDLDESHTEDISDVVDVSRVTDIENETPSYSEDTFSKDDVFFNTSASLGTAPVIPTSSQYGLAIVDANENCGNSPSTCVNNISGSELHVTVPDSVINLVGVKHNETEMRDIHSHPGRNERFKVVKIESTEPFKRGRWICMDYLDHSMIQSQQTQANVSNLPAKEQIDNVHTPATVGHQAADSGICMSEMPQNMNSVEDKVPLNVDKGTQQDQQSTVQYINQNSGQANTGAYSNPSPGQTMQSQPVSISSSQAQMLQQHIQSMSLSTPMNQNMLNSNQHQSLQAQQMQQVIASANMQMPQVPLPQQLTQPVQMQHLQQFQQPQQVQQVIQPMQPVHSIQSQPMQVPQTIIQTIPQQPISAPANYPPTSGHIPQTIQMPVQNQPSPQTYPAAAANLQQCPPGMSQQMISVQQHPMQQPQYYTTQGISMMPSQPQPQQMMTIPTQVAHQQSTVTMQQPYPVQSIPQQQQPPPQQQQQQSQPQSQGQNQQQQQQIPIGHSTSLHHVPASSVTTSMAGYAPVVTGVPTTAQVMAAVSQAASMVPTSQSSATQMIQQMYGTVMQGQMFRNGTVPSSVVDAITSEPGVIERVVQSTGILQELANAASINNENSETPAAGEDPESLAGLARALAHGGSCTDLHQLDHRSVAVQPREPSPATSTSGASAVAIDNKIEQAMDLVKSHLMFAVREEVEVLKEKIAELMDRINHLEFENSFLKANASQETLAQLSSMPQPPSSSSGAP